MSNKKAEIIQIRDQTIKTSLQLGLLFFGGQLIILFFFWQKLPPQVPLFYSRPWGREQLASPLSLFLLPLTSFLVIFVNSFLASLISGEEKLINQLSVIFSAVFSLLCLITLLKIVFLVT